MRRFLAHLLILSVLATNVAWAMDDCSLQYSNEAFDVALELAGDLFGDNQSGAVCDELCVGWLHLIAITPGAKLDSFPATRYDVIRTDPSFHSRDQAPPIRPPQI